jgi:hypothetical protein
LTTRIFTRAYVITKRKREGGRVRERERVDSHDKRQGEKERRREGEKFSHTLFLSAEVEESTMEGEGERFKNDSNKPPTI